MYSIAHVIYGIPLTKKFSDLIDEWENSDEFSPWFEYDNTTCGFTILYSGSADHHVGYCGVELQTFREGEIVAAANLKLQPSKEQRIKAEEKISKLHPELKAHAIETYIVWSTS